MCNIRVPFPTASAMAHLEMEKKMKSLVPRARQQAATKRERGLLESLSGGWPAAKAHRRDLKLMTCSTDKGFLELLKGNSEKAAYGCMAASCSFPVSGAGPRRRRCPAATHGIPSFQPAACMPCCALFFRVYPTP